MVLTDPAKRGQQLRISSDKERLASTQYASSVLVKQLFTAVLRVLWRRLVLLPGGLLFG